MLICNLRNYKIHNIYTLEYGYDINNIKIFEDFKFFYIILKR